MHYTFVAPLLIIAAIAGTVIAIFTFVVVHQAKKMRVASVDSVLTDMAAIYEPYSHTGSGPSA
jgi:mannitol-specific phosphotransferase system IIBC component